jgi:hypothetical protein
VAQRGTVQGDALACQHLRLAIQRQAVTEFADQHMRHKRLGGHAAVNRPLRRWGDHDSPFTGPAGVTRTAGDTDAQLRRHDVQLLAAQFTDCMQPAAAAGAVALSNIDQHLVAQQMRRERTMIAAGMGRMPWTLLIPVRLRSILRGCFGPLAAAQPLQFVLRMRT